MTYSAVQMKKARLELRITDELLEQIDAARGDVSRTRWVERALERALGDGQGGGSAAADNGSRGRAPAPAPTRAPVPKIAGVVSAADLLAAKQARMNAERGKKK